MTDEKRNNDEIETNFESVNEVYAQIRAALLSTLFKIRANTSGHRDSAERITSNNNFSARPNPVRDK